MNNSFMYNSYPSSLGLERKGGVSFNINFEIISLNDSVKKVMNKFL